MRKSRYLRLASVAVALEALALVGVAGWSIRLAHADDASFALSLDVPVAKSGQRTLVHVHIKPGSGYHMNKEYPTALSLTPPDGVTLEKPKQTASDAKKFEEAGADFEIALTAAAPGKKLVSGDLKFAVCSASSCDPKREKVHFTVDVK